MVRALRPVLEQRLAASPVAGHTGVLAVDLYTSQLRLVFEEGRLLDVERAASAPDDADVSLPSDTLTHLLLGNRSVAELEATTPDCQLLTDAGALLLDVLFPPLALLPWEQG
jgi:hypothetical protein